MPRHLYFVLSLSLYKLEYNGFLVLQSGADQDMGAPGSLIIRLPLKPILCKCSYFDLSQWYFSASYTLVPQAYAWLARPLIWP